MRRFYEFCQKCSKMTYVDLILDKNSYFTIVCHFFVEIPIWFTIKLMYFYSVYESIINQVFSTISWMSCLFLSNILFKHYSKLIGLKFDIEKLKFQKNLPFEIITEKNNSNCETKIVFIFQFWPKMSFPYSTSENSTSKNCNFEKKIDSKSSLCNKTTISKMKMNFFLILIKNMVSLF